jgi:steroid 5-alpha reductase family enzyme
MLISVLTILLAMTIIMLSGWIFQRAMNNGGWTDVFWTYGAGLVLAGAALVPPPGSLGSPMRRGLIAVMLLIWAARLGTFGGAAAPTWRQMLVAALVAIWCLRLGTYVAVRVARTAEDVRYADMRRDAGSGFQRQMFWLLIVQAPVTALIGVSVLIAADRPTPGLQASDVAGVVIFLSALTGEALADRQMQRFKADPANAGKVCDRGLWSWSRHPNYLFEALIWVSYAVMGLDPQRPWTIAALAAPLVMWAVVRWGTGIPALEAAMVRSKGEAYVRYQKAVPMLLPAPRRRPAEPN